MMHAWRSALQLLAMVAGVLGPAVGSAEAEENRPRAIVILDGSGSMWGEIGGTPKIAAVQTGLNRLIDQLEGRADLGLMGYGHRRKSDCRDVELAFPPGRIDAAAAKLWIGKFGPRGKTPMAASLSMAAAALAENGKGGHILIVTDGADNCRADPCGVAAALAAADPDLRLSVLILGKTKEDMSKTRCIAEAGRGLIEEISRPEELDSALERFMAGLTGGPPQVEPEQAAPKGPPGLRLSLRLGPGGAEVSEDVAWTVTRDGAEVYKGTSPRPALDLSPGTYTVSVSSGGLTAAQSVDVGSDGPTTAVLDLGAGIVRIALQAGAGAGAVSDAYYTIYRSGSAEDGARTTVAVGRGSPPPLLLPAGSYRAVFEQGLARIERALNVEAGRELVSEIAFDIGTLRLSARAVEGGPPLEDVYITVTEDDPESASGRREIATSAAAEPTFTLRAGLYHLKVERGQAVAVSEATVRGGEETAEEVIVPSGRLVLSSRVAGSPEPIAALVAFRIEGIDQPSAQSLRLNGPRAEVTLAAGRYRVTSQFGSANALSLREVEVVPGGEENVVLEHEAGVVSFGIAGQHKPRNVQWTVKDSQGQAIWVSADPAPEVPLQAGDYEIEVRLADRMLTKRFNVAPGEVKAVEAGPE